jgi:hypothetical protein
MKIKAGYFALFTVFRVIVAGILSGPASAGEVPICTDPAEQLDAVVEGDWVADR